MFCIISLCFVSRNPPPSLCSICLIHLYVVLPLFAVVSICCIVNLRYSATIFSHYSRIDHGLQTRFHERMGAIRNSEPLCWATAGGHRPHNVFSEFPVRNTTEHWCQSSPRPCKKDGPGWFGREWASWPLPARAYIDSPVLRLIFSPHASGTRNELKLPVGCEPTRCSLPGARLVRFPFCPFLSPRIRFQSKPHPRPCGQAFGRIAHKLLLTDWADRLFPLT